MKRYAILQILTLAFASWPMLAHADPPSPGKAGEVLQLALALAVVIAILYVGTVLLKRLSGQHSNIPCLIRILATTGVGQRERVLLLEVENTWLLIGVTQNSVNTLHAFPKGELPATPPLPIKDFGAWLKERMERKNAPRN